MSPSSSMGEGWGGGESPALRPHPFIGRIVEPLHADGCDLDGELLIEVLDLELAALLAVVLRQVAERDGLSDRRTVGQAGGVGAPAERVDQHVVVSGIDDRAVAEREARHTVLVDTVRDREGAEHRRLLAAARAASDRRPCRGNRRP